MCSIESELHVQNLLSILGSMVNIIEGRPIIYDHLMSMRIFTLIVKMVIIRAPKITWQMNRGTNWIFYSTHTNCIFHILWEVGAERKIHLMSSNPSAKNRSPGAQHWFQAKFTNGLKCQIPLERKFCHGSLFSEIWFSTPWEGVPDSLGMEFYNVMQETRWTDSLCNFWNFMQAPKESAWLKSVFAHKLLFALFRGWAIS